MGKFEDIGLSAMALKGEGDASGVRAYKSQLYQMAKCAEGLFGLLEDRDDVEDWVREGIMSSYEQIELKKMKPVMSMVGVISAELAGKHLTEKGSNATK